MSFGSPIAFSEGTQKSRFAPLAEISSRRDDPNSFNENLLQELIDATPNVLPVREYLPSTTRLFSLAREVPVDLGANNGYIDNLLVTNDGYLVIVETKLYRNPEGIREVIAQTLQYGMAIGQMSVMELESRTKRGQSPALTSSENIRDCVTRQATEQNQLAVLAHDFDEALERHLRRGEILLLIVSDGIHIGVERVSHWLNEQGNSTPFKFGLVELKVYAHGSERLVVPRTILKTREVSRHVVIVDVRPTGDVVATTEVRDEFSNAAGGKMMESRLVKSAQPALSQNQLLKTVSSEDLPAVTRIMGELESMGFDQSGTATYLRFGFTSPPDSGAFIPIAYFGKNDVYLSPPEKALKAVDEGTKIDLQRKGHELGFYRAEQVTQPNAPSLNVKYRRLVEDVPKLLTLLELFRAELRNAIEQTENME